MARLAALFLVPLLALTPLAAEAAQTPSASASHPAPAKKSAPKPPANKPAAASKTAEAPHCTCQLAHPKKTHRQAKAHHRRRHLAHRNYNYEKAPALAFAAPPPPLPVQPFHGPEAAPPPVAREAPPDDAQRLDPWHGYDGHDGLRNGY